MACIFLDSCGDHYSAAADVESKWNEPYGVYAYAEVNGVTPNAGRIGSSLDGTQQATHNLPDDYAALVAGLGFYLNPAMGADVQICGFYDAGTLQVGVWLSPSGQLYVKNGAGTVLGRSRPDLIRRNSWNYVELKATFHASAGTWAVRLNGVALLSGSGVATIGSTNAYANQFKAGAGSTRIDDVYVCDTSGSLNKDFLGDIGVWCLRPSGAGTHSDWSPSAGSNYQCVDEATPDSSSYVSTTGVGNRDSYALDDLPANVTAVKAVQVVLNALKEDASDRSLKAGVRSGATDYDGAQQAVRLPYGYYLQPYDADPATSAAWDLAGVNALEAEVVLAS